MGQVALTPQVAQEKSIQLIRAELTTGAEPLGQGGRGWRVEPIETVLHDMDRFMGENLGLLGGIGLQAMTQAKHVETHVVEGQKAGITAADPSLNAHPSGPQGLELPLQTPITTAPRRQGEGRSQHQT